MVLLVVVLASIAAAVVVVATRNHTVRYAAFAAALAFGLWLPTTGAAATLDAGAGPATVSTQAHDHHPEGEAP